MYSTESFENFYELLSYGDSNNKIKKKNVTSFESFQTEYQYFSTSYDEINDVIITKTNNITEDYGKLLFHNASNLEQIGLIPNLDYLGRPSINN